VAVGGVERGAAGFLATIFGRQIGVRPQVIAEGEVPEDGVVPLGINVQLDLAGAGFRVVQLAIATPGSPNSPCQL
jgi:hypothetical protein